jgi:hypothetical protein
MMCGVLHPSLLLMDFIVTCFLLMTIHHLAFLVKLQKSEVLSTFIHLKTVMENNISTKIKVLHTDCRGEYTSNEFKQFCLSNVLHINFLALKLHQ